MKFATSRDGLTWEMPTYLTPPPPGSGGTFCKTPNLALEDPGTVTDTLTVAEVEPTLAVRPTWLGTLHRAMVRAPSFGLHR